MQQFSNNSTMMKKKGSIGVLLTNKLLNRFGGGHNKELVKAGKRFRIPKTDVKEWFQQPKTLNRRQGFYTPYPILKNKRELTVEMSLNYLLVKSQEKRWIIILASIFTKEDIFYRYPLFFCKKLYILIKKRYGKF